MSEILSAEWESHWSSVMTFFSFLMQLLMLPPSQQFYGVDCNLRYLWFSLCFWAKTKYPQLPPLSTQNSSFPIISSEGRTPYHQVKHKLQHCSILFCLLFQHPPNLSTALFYFLNFQFCFHDVMSTFYCTFSLDRLISTMSELKIRAGRIKTNATKFVSLNDSNAVRFLEIEKQKSGFKALAIR